MADHEMQSLCFDDIEKGQGYLTASRVVTGEDVMDFARLTGDHNRLHTDPEYAKGTAFGAPIAHGLLTLSVANGLYMQLGLFERYTVANLGIESWNFKKPVFYGDSLHVHLALEGKRQTSDPRRGVIRWKVTVVNQKGEAVADGIWVKMFLTRAAIGQTDKEETV